MTNMHDLDFAEIVRRAIRRDHRNRKKIADRAGLKRARMDNFMAGDSLPQRTLERLADVLGIGLRWRGRLREEKPKGSKAEGKSEESAK